MFVDARRGRGPPARVPLSVRSEIAVEVGRYVPPVARPERFFLDVSARRVRVRLVAIARSRRGGIFPGGMRASSPPRPRDRDASPPRH